MEQYQGSGMEAYRSQKTLVKVLMVLLLTEGGLNVLSTLLDLAESEESSLVMVMASGAITLLMVIAFLGSIISFCIWVRRANLNARALGAGFMTFSANSCIWWFFVPFAHWFKPYQAVKEIYRNSASESERMPVVPWQFPLWWGCWIISNIISNIELRLSLKGVPVSAGTSLLLSLASAPLHLGAAIGCAAVVWLIHERQEQRSTMTIGQIFT